MPAIEFVLALSLVLVFFGMLLGILIITFPSGPTLEELINDGGASGPVAQQGSFDVALPAGELERSGQVLAVLADARGKVQDRPASAFAWVDSRRGMGLGRRHAVQTFDSSGAIVAFDEQNRLELGERSLMILRDRGRREKARSFRASAVMIEGEFLGHLAPGTANPVGLELETDRASYTIDPARQAPANFKVDVRADRSTTFSLYEGQASVKTQDGEQSIPPNHSISVDSAGRASPPVPLPPTPTLQQPVEDERFAFQSSPPAVAFGWGETGPKDDYRLVIARDEQFRQIVLDEELSATEFVHGNMAAGKYFWRVTARRSSGEGRPSAPRALWVVEDVEPPELTVQFPRELNGERPLVLRGRVEPEAKVFVDDIEVPIGASGEFQHDLDLRPGLNLVVVEAIDSVGNTSYASQVLRRTVE
jgi:hypothetical protein